MSEPINDGGPAFPVPPPIAETDGVMMQWRHAEGGMTLRDYLAAHAMTGLLSNKNMTDMIMNATHEPTEIPSAISEMAYDVADAMIKAREVKP